VDGYKFHGYCRVEAEEADRFYSGDVATPHREEDNRDNQDYNLDPKVVKRILGAVGLRQPLDNEWVEEVLMCFAQKGVNIRGMKGYKLERKLKWLNVLEHNRVIIAQHVLK
jgi:hypothetical protein